VIENVIERAKKLVDVGRLNLTFRGIQRVPKEINLLRNCLTYLMLNDNKLEQFPFALYSTTWLQKLNLRNNQLAVFPSDLPPMPFLNELWLEGNRLTSLPNLNMPRLQRLWLNNNQLS